MRYFSKLLLFAVSAAPCLAQLTMDQKVADFQGLASLLDKRYAPYEWKRDVFKFDLMEISPWLTRIQATKDDLDFYEVMSEYAASLNDAHVGYFLPSNFVARLNFSVDVFDGKLLVDTINRTRLPASEFGFAIGYELVSIDGQDAQKLLDSLLRYQIAGNPRSTRRFAATLLTARSQQLMPHAADVPEVSSVMFRRLDGNLESYRIPWTKTGLRMLSVGRYTTPTAAAHRAAKDDTEPVPEESPLYMEALNRLLNCRLPDKGLVGYGSLTPVFATSLPSGFVPRLGRVSTDPFYSGTFAADGLKIGFIRIPSYSPSNPTTAITAFQNEIAYFQANTDGLVVDVMRNPGGDFGYANALLSYLMNAQWRSIPFEVRATSEWVVEISSALEQVKALGAPKSILDLYQAIKDQIVNANGQMRTRTDPIPVDDVTVERDPARDTRGNLIAYTKPVMILGDELTASAAEAFLATIQDNARGPFFGWRSMGAGGNVENWYAGTYSLGFASVTEAMMVRKNAMATAEYPTTSYIENVGVRPDIQADYMTAENLMQNGKPFVDAFTAAIVNYIRTGK